MSLEELILEVMKQINGNTTGSMNANISDTVDLFIDSLNSDSLQDKCERLLDAELGDVGLTSLNAKLQYWLIQRVEYTQGDSLEDLLYRYLINLYNVNQTALAHYVNFTDNVWHDVINDYDADLVESNCVSATTASTLTFATELESADSITNSGTATVTLSTTGITVTADGTLFEVYVNGELFPFAEGNGSVAYGESNSIALTDVTWTTQDAYHYNLLNGFDMYADTSGNIMRVPVGSTVSQTGWEKVDTFVAGANYIPAETKFKLPAEADLIAADDGQFFTGGVPNALSYEEIINATAQQEILGIESTVGTDGQGQAVISGISLYQDILNGNTATNVISDATGTNIGVLPNGQWLFNTNYSTSEQVFNVTAGDKVYVFCELEDTSIGNITGIRLVFDDNSFVSTPLAGSSKISDILISTYTGKMNFKIREGVAGQVDRKYQMMINLTQLGQDTLTVDQCDFMIRAYFEGLQHVKNPILYSVGKNLFDYNDPGILPNYVIDSSGNLMSSSSFTTTHYIPVQPNTNYITNRPTSNAAFYDANKNLLGGQAGSAPITTPNQCAFIRTYTNPSTLPLDEFFVGLGSIFVAYEPFKQSKMTILSDGGGDLELRSATGFYQDAPIYGIEFDTTVSGDSAVIRTDDAVGLDSNDMLSVYPWSNFSEVTDSYGNTFVRIPKHYMKIWDDGDVRHFQVSEKPFPGSWLPWCFWDFDNEQELDYVDYGKYTASVDGSSRLESKADKYPDINHNIVQMRTFAENNGTGYQQTDIHTEGILQNLFAIHHKVRNSQSIYQGYVSGQYSDNHDAVVAETSTNRIIIANAYADLYQVGQAISVGTARGSTSVFYGRTITSIDVYDASNKAITFDGDLVDIAVGNNVWNSPYKSGWSTTLENGFAVANDGKSPCAYMGIENPWGNQWKFVDGVNINDYQAWIALDARDYASNVFASPYKQLGYVNSNSNGYVEKFGFDALNPWSMFPTNIGSSAFWGDYYYKNTGAIVALLGGNLSYGSPAGLRYWGLLSSSSNANWTLGGRLVRKAVTV